MLIEFKGSAQDKFDPAILGQWVGFAFLGSLEPKCVLLTQQPSVLRIMGL
jgi:hypothetical protein